MFTISPTWGAHTRLLSGRVPGAGARVSICGNNCLMHPVQSRREAAQSLVEFGLLIALVAVVCIAGLLIFGATVT